MNWKKKGLIYCPNGQGFFKTHATRPIAYRLDDENLRLFFSSRDADDRMLPTFIDVQAAHPSRIVRMCDRPLIDVGRPGTFDDSGVTVGCVVDFDDCVMIYYTGWKRRRVVSFELSIGMLCWDRQTDTFSRRFEGPIISQDTNHPFQVAGPFVMFDEARYKMWYCSGTDWKFPDERPEPIYTVFYAESSDGIKWEPRGRAINYKFDGEVVSAPWVLKHDGKYLMWYSFRGHDTKAAKNYTIGFAESNDGLHWERRDEAVGISRSETGWDSEMICYPTFYSHAGEMYMIYSGNGVGRAGIGYAVAKNFLT
jgi:hypothetical protein